LKSGPDKFPLRAGRDDAGLIIAEHSRP
jgi:hypothetical protein